jgi:tetratricopeptide (TPR) repeat protein
MEVINLYLDREALEEATELVDQAIQAQGGRRTPELSVLQLKKANISRAYGDRSGEVSWLEQAFVSNRMDSNIVCEMADVAEEMEEWDLALKALKQISFLKTECRISRAESFYRQGRIAFFQEDDKKRAVLFIRKALQEDENREEAKRLLEEIAE